MPIPFSRDAISMGLGNILATIMADPMVRQKLNHVFSPYGYILYMHVSVEHYINIVASSGDREIVSARVTV